jgi:hypothetical protein
MSATLRRAARFIAPAQRRFLSLESPARQPMVWRMPSDYARRLAHSEPVLSEPRRSPVSMAQRVDGDHFELPADAVELLRQVRPGDRQRFIEEVTEALAVAADTKDFAQLQRVLAAWAATIRLQRRPGYEPTIRRMQRRERGVPVDIDELRHPRG